jgi:hypothetical protein
MYISQGSLREVIIFEAHSNRLGGHFGRNKHLLLSRIISYGQRWREMLQGSHGVVGHAILLNHVVIILINILHF